MFDGQFKSKPVVALRGSSHAGLPAGHVIAENRKRRETRRAHRQEEDAALTVQRIMRGILTRSRVRKESRSRFEHSINQGNLGVTTRLLCNFYDARCDHDKLVRLWELVEKLWDKFTAPSFLYSRTMFLLKCIEDLYHQLCHLSQHSESLCFIDRIVSHQSFDGDKFLAQYSLDKAIRSYWKLVLLVDVLADKNPSLVRLIQVMNTRYHELILKYFVVNDKVKNFKRTADLLFPTWFSLKHRLDFLKALDLKLIVSKLQVDANVNLDKIVYFLLKLITDSSSCNQALDVLFTALYEYQIPSEVISSSADSTSSDSSDDEMEIDKPQKIVLQFDCLEQLFVKCCTEQGSSCYEHLSRIAYLIITKFGMPVIQTSPIRWLCLRTEFLRWLWEEVSTKEVSSVFSSGVTLCLSKMAENKSLTNSEYQSIIPPLTVFSALYYEYLRASHDADIIESSAALFSLSQLRQISVTCRDLAVHMTNMDLISVQPHKTLNFRSAFTAHRHITVPGSIMETQSRIVLGVQDWVSCWSSIVKLTGELHRRDSRLDFFDNKDDWLSTSRIQNITKENVGVFIDPLSVPNLSLNTIKELYILHGVPFTVPFSERVEIFHHILNTDLSSQGGGGGLGPTGHPNSGVIKASIRRDYIYEDAFAQLTESVAPNLKNRIQIQLINYTGLDEAGVDGGGLFREFLSTFLTEAFNPNRGFFIETDGLLHPNPAAQSLYPDFTKHYFFIGRLLGKAVYEKLLVDLPLASYLLEKLLGSDADVNHLRALDPDMYRNLLSLRGYSEDTIADLCLYFIVSDNILGETRTIELKPNGAATQVTKSNLIEYIHLMADYRLNRQIRVHFRNFAEGFYSVVSRDWLRMFSYSEFQSLISGSTAEVDISDLRENTVYHGVYNEQHPTIAMFWNVVDGMSAEQHRKLLSFVTSSDRTPLLGFGALTPLFAIHSAGVDDRLPTASTCMNLLKLPEFSDAETLEKRLLYVIESGAGFELS